MHYKLVARQNVYFEIYMKCRVPNANRKHRVIRIVGESEYGASDLTILVNVVHAVNNSIQFIVYIHVEFWLSIKQ